MPAAALADAREDSNWPGAQGASTRAGGPAVARESWQPERAPVVKAALGPAPGALGRSAVEPGSHHSTEGVQTGQAHSGHRRREQPLSVERAAREEVARDRPQADAVEAVSAAGAKARDLNPAAVPRQAQSPVVG